MQRSDLIGQYVGQTEKVTRSVIEKSKGGVLFVDEAYRLTPRDSTKYYGQCAVEELMKEMEIHDPVMIFAGYPKEMKQFFDSNAGLYRRIPLVLNFPDYSREELGKILQSVLIQNQYHVDDDSSIEEAIGQLQDQQIACMNAGICQLIFQKARDSLINRLDPLDFMSADLNIFSKNDVITAARSLPTIPVGRL